MKVYPVFEGYEDLIGVFSTKQKAEDYVRKHITKYPSIFGGRERYSVLEHTLDDPSADEDDE